MLFFKLDYTSHFVEQTLGSGPVVYALIFLSNISILTNFSRMGFIQIQCEPYLNWCVSVSVSVSGTYLI